MTQRSTWEAIRRVTLYLGVFIGAVGLSLILTMPTLP